MSTIVVALGKEITAVSDRRDVVFEVESTCDHTSAKLKARFPSGAPTTIAGVAVHERIVPHGRVNRYGSSGLQASYLAQFCADRPGSHTATVNTDADASLALGDGISVADAGGNAIVHVSCAVVITTTAVLAPTPAVLVTAEVTITQGVPSCAAGHCYRYESVPTDVELGADDFLCVDVAGLVGGPNGTIRPRVIRLSTRTGNDHGRQVTEEDHREDGGDEDPQREALREAGEGRR